MIKDKQRGQKKGKAATFPKTLKTIDVVTNLGQGAEIAKIYGEWLGSFQWTYYATLTTKYRLSMPAARKAAEGMAKELGKGGSYRFFFAIEPFDLRNGFHIHALIDAPTGYQYKHLIQIWQHVSGNKRKKKEGETESTWNRIDLQTYDPKLGAKHYVGKYIMKQRTDYDMLTNK